MPNTVYNKVTINGTTYIDLSTDTAVASDVAQGKYFHLATGERVAGTASGGGDNALIIQFSQNATTGYWEPDKTFAEIQTAYNNGLDIVLTSPNDSYAVDGGFDGSDEALYYQVYWYDYATDRVYANYYIFDSNGVADDDGGELIPPPTGTKQISITENGITIEDVTNYANASIAVNVSGGQPNLQAKTNISPTTSSQTIQPDSGYDGLSSVQINAMPSGTAGTPTATKGTVSNHQVSVTPSVTNTTGYITGSTKTGTAVTVNVTELESGTKSITANGTGISVSGYSTVDVAVPTGSSKALYKYEGLASRTANSYGATNAKVTVAKAGTYNISYVAIRGSSSGTMGTNLYIGSTAKGNQQTWNNGTYGQYVSYTNQSISANTDVTIYATSGNNSRTIYVGQLIVEEV